jgi:hypothetical protein
MTAQAEQRTRFFELLSGHQCTQMLYVAAKLGLADLLRHGPRDAAALAAETETDPVSLYRVLRALAGFGVFRETGARCFELTALGEQLAAEGASSLRNAVLARGEDYYPTWSELLYSVQTGKPAFERVFGMSNWAYRQAHPDVSVRFNSFCADMARERADALLASPIDLAGAGVIVDAGGGDGTLLRAILARWTRARGVLFDLPHVIDAVRDRELEPGLPARLSYESGSFFDGVPKGGDVYILSAVLHDWDDAQSKTILDHCRAAMHNQSRLLIIERVIPPANSFSQALLWDLDMLVNTGGCERDEDEWRLLLRRSGLELRSAAETASPFYILESVPA